MEAPFRGVVVYWPTYPTVTPGGKDSLAKKAGKKVPWLSANVIRSMHPRAHHEAMAMWHDAVTAKAEGRYTKGFPAKAVVILGRSRGYKMDFGAVAEGAKSLIDGLVASGVIPDDTMEYIRGIEAECLKVPVGQEYVFLGLEPL